MRPQGEVPCKTTRGIWVEQVEAGIVLDVEGFDGIENAVLDHTVRYIQILEIKTNLFSLILSDIFIVYLKFASLSNKKANVKELKCLIAYLIEEYEENQVRKRVYVIIRDVAYDTPNEVVQQRVEGFLDFVWNEIIKNRDSFQNIIYRDAIEIKVFPLRYHSKRLRLEEEDLLVIREEIMPFSGLLCDEPIGVRAKEAWYTVLAVYTSYFPPKPRIAEEVKVEEERLVDDEGKQIKDRHTIYRIQKLIEKARKAFDFMLQMYEVFLFLYKLVY